jgi:hypothetical protein
MAEVGDPYRLQTHLLRHVPAIPKEQTFNPGTSKPQVTSVQQSFWAFSCYKLTVTEDTRTLLGYIKCLVSMSVKQS